MMNKNFNFLERGKSFLIDDVNSSSLHINNEVRKSKFLILGAAGSIGHALSKEIFKRNPLKLHLVDISENNLVEVTRDIRSSFGYIEGDFKTFALDIGSWQYDKFFESDGDYDYVMNLSALKHVRSEKDVFTLMRMIEVNILNTIKTIDQCISKNVKKYFCVSSDKATNSTNLMGASKRIMELFLINMSKELNISSARFANVAFSDGSLLHSFNNRIKKGQPIVAPSDTKRYFISHEEAGQLCLLSTILGENRDIFFPKMDPLKDLYSFSEIALLYIKNLGFSPIICKSEIEARNFFKKNNVEKKWPCFFSVSDTTGEKMVEEFFDSNDLIDTKKFKNLGIIKNKHNSINNSLNKFLNDIENIKNSDSISKNEIIKAFKFLLKEFEHLELSKSLDDKM